jgi:hypothetical protein
MSVAEIKSALRELEPSDLNAIESFMADLRLEQEVAAGEFDARWETAKQDVDAGKGKPLDDLINDDA